jgi:hypothetical protein
VYLTALFVIAAVVSQAAQQIPIALNRDLIYHGLELRLGGAPPPIVLTAVIALSVFAYYTARAAFRREPTEASCECGSTTAQAAQIAPVHHTDVQTAREHVGLTVPEVVVRLESLRKQGEPYSSTRKLAQRLGCATSTISKAINSQESLKRWAPARPQSTPRAQSINAMVTDRTEQTRELDPAVEAAIRLYLEEHRADSEVEEWLYGLPEKDLREVLDDPDKHPRILGRKP